MSRRSDGQSCRAERQDRGRVSNDLRGCAEEPSEPKANSYQACDGKCG